MYRTIRAIFHRGHLYNVGDKYTPTAQEVKDKSVDRRHFVLEKDFGADVVEGAMKEDIQARKVHIKARKVTD